MEDGLAVGISGSEMLDLLLFAYSIYQPILLMLVREHSGKRHPVHNPTEIRGSIEFISEFL